MKATDHDVPLLTRIFPMRPDAKSKAKVEIQQLDEQSGMLPWAVPDVEPAAVAAIFVDENTGNITTPPQLLCNVEACAGRPSPDDKLSDWVTQAGDDLVNLVGGDTGVVILVPKVDDTPSLSSGGRADRDVRPVARASSRAIGATGIRTACRTSTAVSASRGHSHCAEGS